MIVNVKIVKWGKASISACTILTRRSSNGHITCTYYYGVYKVASDNFNAQIDGKST